MFEIVYHPKVLHQDIVRLDKRELGRVRDVMETKLGTRPGLYGMRLRGELEEYWKIRVGDFRIVYKLEKQNIFVLAIRNRKEVYEIAQRRI